MHHPPPDIETILNALAVSRETQARLATFAELLLKWQQHINLIASPEHLWHRHILDSMELLKHLPATPGLIADLGSGGGFPGIILSICTPHHIHFIESDKRKASFLREALRVTYSTGTVYAQRIESVLLKCDVITARACASLERLLSLSEHLWSPSVTGLFMKGQQVQEEIKEAELHWRFHYTIHPHSLSREGNILSINAVSKL